MKIIGATIGTPLPKPNFDQTDPKKGDYIRGDRSFLKVDETLTQSGISADAKAVGEALANKQSVGDYALRNEIPVDISAFNNDVGYLTEHQSLDGLATESYVNNQIDSIIMPDVAGQIDVHNMSDSAHNDIRNLIDAIVVPTKVSELDNDKNYLSAIPSEYVTETELAAKGYLTEHQSLSDYAKTNDLGNLAFKDNLTASEVGADASGTANSLVASHNTNTAAHSDIRTIISDVDKKLYIQDSTPVNPKEGALWLDTDAENVYTNVYIPVKGVDYFTEADKEDLNIPVVTQEAGDSESLVMSQKAVTDLVNDALGKNNTAEYETVDSVDEMTDTTKQYVLSSTGTIWAYGQHGEPQPQFTNLATDVQVGRLNSSGSIDATASDARTVADYVDFVTGDVVRVKGLTLGGYNTTIYNASKSSVISAKPTIGSWNNITITQEADGIYVLTSGTSATIKYIRFSGVLTGNESDVVVTRNQEITYTEGYAWYDTEIVPETASGGGNYVDLLVKVNQNKSNIAEVSSRVTALETGSGTVTIPSFWESAVNVCISKIKGLQVGKNCVTFPFFSDNHQRNGYAGMLIAHIMKECNIPYCFYGGDSISSGTIADEAAMIAQDKAFDTIMSYVPNGKLCRAVGNHDGYWYDGTNRYSYTREQVYELFLREESIAQNKHFGDDGTYYYVDDIASKVRFIVLNTNDVDSAQLAWLQNTALELSDSGWAVVFISHHPIANYYQTNITNANAVISAVASKNVDVIGWFSGHIHRDRMTTNLLTGGTDTTAGTPSTELGFTQVTITSDHTGIAYKNDDGTESPTKHTVANDDQSHAIDFVTINKGTRKVNITRLGIGNDRSYTY